MTHDGAPVAFTTERIKGVEYAFFPADPGTYAATYGTAPSLVNQAPAMERGGARGSFNATTVTR